ncbi:MAG TPA: SDR family NAD(P)-dependent oxidoreductase, partial [Burkholderiaceae bacterium]|nr:SDR family NAD(P)-dependent oxidoreductase [Burkholderiaceae bacterium]
MAAAREMRDRDVVVTGAAGGLGTALAECYAALGAKLALLDLDAARAEALAARLRAQGANAHAFGCDIADEGACSAAIAQARRALGGIDLLVNNAGISARLLLADAT